MGSMHAYKEASGIQTIRVSRVWWLGRGRVAYSPEDSNTVCDGPPNNHGHGRIVDVVGI